jgi:CoA-transferase family III
MPSLIDAIAQVGDRLRAASAALGKPVSVDPQSMLERDAPLSPPNLWSPNRQCRLVQTRDGWLAVNLARECDRAAVAAWLECDVSDDIWSCVIENAAQQNAVDLRDRAVLLHMPVAIVGETEAREDPAPLRVFGRPRPLKALDLSALWAGPLCGALLAEAGVQVTRIESAKRPDFTAISTPKHFKRLNASKARRAMELNDPELLDLVADADILITSGRPHALARAGLDEARLFALNPSLLWIAITAHGWREPHAIRVGFGDDTAAAGGLVDWVDGKPNFMGDALADPLTGLLAATQALEAIIGGKAGVIDAALAPTAQHFSKLMAS